jgi:NADH-quinone oxidoreductase subunit A
LQTVAIPIVLFFATVIGLGVFLLLLGKVCNPSRLGRVKQMPYESGMDPIHDTRRRFDVRFHLLAIAFLVFDVELLFLYPWAVAVRDRPEGTVSAGWKPGGPEGGRHILGPETGGRMSQSPTPIVRPAFVGGFVFLVLLTLGFVYDWRKGVFRWR